MKRAASPSPTARAKRPRPAPAAPLWPPVPQGGNANALGTVTVSKGGPSKHFAVAQRLVVEAAEVCMRYKRNGTVTGGNLVIYGRRVAANADEIILRYRYDKENKNLEVVGFEVIELTDTDVFLSLICAQKNFSARPRKTSAP